MCEGEVCTRPGEAAATVPGGSKESVTDWGGEEKTGTVFVALWLGIGQRVSLKDFVLILRLKFAF